MDPALCRSHSVPSEISVSIMQQLPVMWQARRQARKAVEGDVATAAEENGHPARAALNTLKAARPRGPRARQAAATAQAAGGISRPKRKGLFAAASDSENRPSGGMLPSAPLYKHITVLVQNCTSLKSLNSWLLRCRAGHLCGRGIPARRIIC